ncbi:hypothetical protein LZ906_017385 (plasmid) [Paraclostridium ghonii]|uniref:hypothetical protein n=1 Tax=Paraclostridium ghonii TaxID=29358 RepID=UPI00202CEE79|nr:hypothetical protein [Paeniclostridium ghonii]MCM0167616.1 hypothetical protein [Paeniclostridium ghonii]
MDFQRMWFTLKGEINLKNSWGKTELKELMGKVEIDENIGPIFRVNCSLEDKNIDIGDISDKISKKIRKNMVL